MSFAHRLAGAGAQILLLAGIATATYAQVPFIEGTWQLNVAASKFPGPPPQTHVRSYRMRQDGALVGTAVIVESNGNPRFLIFAGKPDGTGHPEFETQTAAQYLIDGTPPPRTYAEMPTDDDHKVKWIDKIGDRVLFSGERWVSKDGKTMAFTVDGLDRDGRPAPQQLFVFDRTGP